MSDKSHEQAAFQEIQELKLSELEEHDTIMLETASGSTYSLTVVDPRHGRPLVVMDRQSDHPVRAGEHSVDMDDLLKFSLLGSCQGFLSSGGGEVLAPVSPDNKLILVDKSVRLQSETGEPLYTSSVASIKLVKATSD